MSTAQTNAIETYADEGLDRTQLTPAAKRRRAEKAACKCASEEQCEVHEYVCACSDRRGRCLDGCHTCLGSGIVGALDYEHERCNHCTDAAGDASSFRGLGGIL